MKKLTRRGFVIVTASGFTAACSSDPDGGGMQSPTSPSSPAPPPTFVASGRTTKPMKLLDVLREAGHNVSNMVRFGENGPRRFMGLDNILGLNNPPNSEWNIYVGDKLYGVGPSNRIDIDIPNVDVPANTDWRVVKVSIGYIAAATLLAIGWFNNSRNRQAVRTSRAKRRACATRLAAPEGGGPPPLPSFFKIIFQELTLRS